MIKRTISALVTTIIITLFILMAWYGFAFRLGEVNKGVYIRVNVDGVAVMLID